MNNRPEAKRVLVAGYGSIGKRHCQTLLKLGIRPYVLTSFPDDGKASFVKRISSLKGVNINYAIIATPTSRHLSTLKLCLKNLKGVKNFLIEKPLEASSLQAEKIIGLKKTHNLRIAVGYNLRFLEAFGRIRKIINSKKNSIRMVEVVAGQDLNEWRLYKPLRESYSAFRRQGGGVDLDLSHEVDYILWLFGNKYKRRFLLRDKISNLPISSPDFCKLILDYGRFIVDITLDYIRRPKERYLKIICENEKMISFDFNNKREIELSYLKMMESFLGLNKEGSVKLCSISEASDVLRILKL